MRTRSLNTAVCLLGACIAFAFTTSSVAQQAGCGDDPKFKKLCKDCGPYAWFFRPWLQEDVAWIVTDGERAAFLKLNNDEERDNFIDMFWLRRDPTPDTIENEFREDHYRRIAYANEHFAADRPGWDSDRGRIYVLYGPPDQIERDEEVFPEQANKPDAGSKSYPVETWRYRYIEGVGQEVLIKFVDTCRCGEYLLAITPAEKDNLLNLRRRDLSGKQDGRDFNEFVHVLAAVKPPSPRYKYLEEIVTHRYTFKEFPFQLSTNAVKLTNASNLVPLTIQFANRDVT